jgi:hypothetical protein
MDSDFVKMEKSDDLLMGNPQIIVCGFKLKEQIRFSKLLKKCFIVAPIVYPTDSHKATTIKEINSLEPNTGKGETSLFSPAVIVAGISQKQFNKLLDRTKKSTIRRPLWATITKTSQDWELSKLLGELSQERASMG